MNFVLALLCLCGSALGAQVLDKTFLESAAPTPKLTNTGTGLPIIVWHGLGDFCDNPISMVPFVKFVRRITKSSMVHCLQIGETWYEDAENGWFMNANKQVEYGCKQLEALKLGTQPFYGLGLSQGGLFSRALLQRCDAAKHMKRLVAIAGPQQGVQSIPQCDGNATICEVVSDILDLGIYTSFVQDNISPANYWHDSNDRAAYLKGSTFLPDINNALPKKNPQYKQRLMALEAFVMVEFSGDTVVFPRDSEHFGYFVDGSVTQRESLRQSELYKQDWLGLKALDQQNKLHFYTSPGNHLQFTQPWFIANLLQYLV